MSAGVRREAMRLLCCLLLACGVPLACQAASAEDEVSAERFQASGLNSSFAARGTSIPEYVALARKMVANGRVDLTGAERERVIEGNAPFDLLPPGTCPAGKSRTYRRGIVLTHGLTDSPYFMRGLARFFQENCFRVLAILLPGHGTRPGDLLQVKWQDWLDAERFGVDALAQEVDDVYLLGFSMGGSLSLYESLQDKRVRGLFLFAPAIQVSRRAVMADLLEAVGAVAPRLRWVDVMPDEDPFKYESFPANAAFQIHLLSVQLRSELVKRILIPTFLAVSEDDATVDASAALVFFRLAVHPLSTAVLYSARKDASVAEVSPDKVLVVDSAVPGQRIIGSAHTALVVPPDDPHYGMHRDYANCQHYFPGQQREYRLCKSGNADFLGEITASNLKRGVVERLMYNPNFDALRLALKRFVDSLPSD
jgi:esterase/lipase